MAIAGVGTAVAALLFGLTFQRMTTILITAAREGAFDLRCSVFVLQGGAYAASHMSWWPVGAFKRYAMLAGLAVVGIAIQCRIFRRPPDKAPKKTPSPQLVRQLRLFMVYAMARALELLHTPARHIFDEGLS